MWILIVTPSYPPEYMSCAARMTKALAVELVDARESVAVVALRSGPAPMAPRIYTYAGSNPAVHWLAGGASRRCGEIGRLFEEVLAAFVPNVVHPIGLESGFSQALDHARERGVPVVDHVPGCVLVDPELASAGPRRTPQERGALALVALREVEPASHATRGSRSFGTRPSTSPTGRCPSGGCGWWALCS